MTLLLISVYIVPIHSDLSIQTLLENIFLKLSIFLSFGHILFVFLQFFVFITLLIINYFIFIKTSFKQGSIKTRKKRNILSVKMSGKLSGLIKKDIYYLFKNRNYYITVFITLLYIKYIFLDKNPSEYSVFVLMFFMFIPSTTFALNIFGFVFGQGREGCGAGFHAEATIAAGKISASVG